MGGTEPLESELAELAARRDALQQAAGLPGAQLQPILDAAFAELDGAIDALITAQAQAAARKADAPSRPLKTIAVPSPAGAYHTASFPSDVSASRPCASLRNFSMWPAT